jgi:hypothetical protein
MHREDNSRFVLYIEPRKEEKSAEPIDDELTAKVEAAFAQAISGAANYPELESPRTSMPGTDGAAGITRSPA